MTGAPCYVARRSDHADALRDALEPAVTAALELPATSLPEPDRRIALERMLAEISFPEACANIVVCTWPASLRNAVAVTLTPEEFAALIEDEVACWAGVLARAVGACADNGSVVAVVELPAALDVAGHVTTVVVGQALVNFARSLAAGEGKRNVRVNVVTTSLLTAPDVPLGVAPPLSSFPGRPAHEVAGAVRLLLSADACGVTGTVVHCDCGRS